MIPNILDAMADALEKVDDMNEATTLSSHTIEQDLELKFERWNAESRGETPQPPPPLAPKNNHIENKPRASLLPLDVLIRHLTPAYEEGCIKYQRESWRGGFRVSALIDAALRHIDAFFWGGEDYDPESALLGIQKHHLAGAFFSLLSILHTLDTRPDCDDRPHKLPPLTWPEPIVTHYTPEDD